MVELTEKDCEQIISKKGRLLAVPSVDLEQKKIEADKRVSAMYWRLKYPVKIPTKFPEHRDRGKKGDYLFYQPITQAYFIIERNQFKASFG